MFTFEVLGAASKKQQAKNPPQECPKTTKDKITPICTKRLCLESQIRGMKPRFDHKKSSLMLVKTTTAVVAAA